MCTVIHMHLYLKMKRVTCACTASRTAYYIPYWPPTHESPSQIPMAQSKNTRRKYKEKQFTPCSMCASTFRTFY